ncbi:MAG TPA: helix-turn-helix domain-containing protein [Solirubrobacteraceae bacterium]|nr:helix-turn-helix domain-containing protein [Solirubrobacteraceae bacterium]
MSSHPNRGRPTGSGSGAGRRDRTGGRDGDGRGSVREAGPTAALFVRIPAEYARRLDRAAFELQVPKQSLVSELVERYVDPESPASLQALAMRSEAGRRVTVETLDQGELTVGHHGFRPAAAPEVLTAQDAAELLQVPQDVVLELARAGRLPGRELGGEWRFARAALLVWLAAGDANG